MNIWLGISLTLVLVGGLLGINLFAIIGLAMVALGVAFKVGYEMGREDEHNR